MLLSDRMRSMQRQWGRGSRRTTIMRSWFAPAFVLVAALGACQRESLPDPAPPGAAAARAVTVAGGAPARTCIPGTFAGPPPAPAEPCPSPADARWRVLKHRSAELGPPVVPGGEPVPVVRAATCSYTWTGTDPAPE